MISFNNDSIRLRVISGFFSRYDRHHLEWIMFASIAVAKSKQKECILIWKLFFTSTIAQFIISWSMKVEIRLSFMLLFCRMARQNLWVTFPCYCYFRIYCQYTDTFMIRCRIQSLLL